MNNTTLNAEAYGKFLVSKRRTFIDSGFEVDDDTLNSHLFDFQKHIVKIALRKGKFAIFADCGLGKTVMMLSWSEKVHEKTGSKVLILAPLAVVNQTKREADKFGINPNCFDITNYDQLDNIDTSKYAGIVLDESSILKSRDGATSSKLIATFKNTPYKLACTATPSPNDHMELGQHSEFLNGMTYLELLSMYFVHDGGETSKWRLRKHATDDFWKYVCTWSISVDNPKTIGFNHLGYELPAIEYVEHFIEVENHSHSLFGDVAVSATDLHKDLNRSMSKRIDLAVKIANELDGQCIIWGLKNIETDNISSELDSCINVQGSDSPEYKAKHLNGFANREFLRLVTKTSIASFGMNYQQCHNMIFLSYDFKFEAFYQAVRRCYRFGQKNKVVVHLLIPESQQNVRKTILEKQERHFQMIHQMAKYSSETDYRKNKREREYNNQAIKFPSFLTA